MRLFALCFVFFFSSRRRHTRSDRDWSSDVCSSDLIRFGRRPTNPEVEPAQVYGSTQIELAWTVVPFLIVVVLFLVDRKSTRLNSSHDQISYAVFCLKKKKRTGVDASNWLVEREPDT